MLQKIKAKLIIKSMANEKGITEEEIRKDMMEAIDTGYNNPDVRERWDEIFGAGHKPEPEEFILKMADLVKNSHME